MKLYIYDNKINTYNLPSKSLDDFVITYQSPKLKSNVLITLRIKDGAWVIVNNVGVSVVNYVDWVVKLELYNCYRLKVIGAKDVYLTLIMMPPNEQMYKLKINNLTKIGIGKDDKNIIKYSNSCLADVHCKIEKIDSKWYVFGLENPDYPFYINKEKCKKKLLKPGDIIVIFGLKIVWLQTFIVINNPLNRVVIQHMSLIENSDSMDKIISVSEDDVNVDLYSSDDYFYHTPRIREVLEEKSVTIDPPPNEDKRENLPFILTLGSSFIMLSSTFMMSYNIIDGLNNGKKVSNLIPQIVMVVAMIIGSLLIPSMSKFYQKKLQKKKSKLRYEKYTKYLDDKVVEINLIIEENKKILRETYLSYNECEKIIKLKQDKLWCREITDDDFLVLRLGVGKLSSNIKITAPEEHFTLEEDQLLENVYNIVKSYKYITDVPITVSIKDNSVLSFLFDSNNTENYINSLILQLVALHSPIDVNIVIFTDNSQNSNLNYTKMLPHCFSEDKKIRYYASNIEDAKLISNHLTEVLQERKEKLQDKESNFLPYYLIITDNYKKYQNISIIQDVIKKDEKLSIALICLDSSIQNVPKSSNYFISINDNDCSLINNISGSNNKIEFKCDEIGTIDMSSLTLVLANIPIQSKGGSSSLPTSLPFLDMFGVYKIEQLNILNRWSENNPVNSLDAPVGVHTDGDLFMLNLHEKYHGPHGLVAGMTGSGKSEFIITYILSMAVNFHPYEVQFVLIDYKGGGLAGAFENRETNVVLPHLAGTITNLDISEMNRTLVSIQSELKRRQRIFNEVRDELNESTIDIYKYQRLYREGVISQPMSHLFIISDEFAELKQQQPEFMQQLISTARIGRSLGVHLILATQKPSGVVNDQIWSNTKFRVCLKVQNRSDSMEMLKKPDAASIKETGRFYLQVGYDDYFELGQSAWSGAKYYPSDQTVIKQDNSINFINEVGAVIKSSSSKSNIKVQASGEQLTNLVKYLADLGKRENIKTTKLWLDAIPAVISVYDLKIKYNYKPRSFTLTPVIGEYDEPENQKQGLVTLDLTNVGNAAIYGIVGSGKEDLIKTIIFSSIVEHNPKEVNIYILDFGSGSLKVFKNMPHVGDIVLQEDGSKVDDFFKMIMDEIETRKELFSDYAGSYTEYLNASGTTLPLIEVIINQYESFVENYSRLSDSVTSIYRDGPKYGIVFILTSISTTGIRGRMLQSFNNKICLQLPNEGDYRTVINTRKKVIPAKFPGRGVIELNGDVFEFQTACFCDKKNMNEYLKKTAKELTEAYGIKANQIPTIPEIVTFEKLKPLIQSIDKLPIGYDYYNKKVQYFNILDKRITSILTVDMTDERMSFTVSFIKELAMFQNVKIIVIDLVNALEEIIGNVEIVKENYDQLLVRINNDILNSLNENILNFYVFLGIGEFKNHISKQGMQLFEHIMGLKEKLQKTYFVFVDTYYSYKQISVDAWYVDMQNYVQGIWLGENIISQKALPIRILDSNDRNLQIPYLGYYIKDGKYKVIRHMVDYAEEEDGK